MLTIVGDIHGFIELLVDYSKIAKEAGCVAMCQVGDFIYFNTKPNVQNFGSVPFEPTHGDAYFVVREKDIYCYVEDTADDDLPF